jgi:hypothetical protein
VQSGSHRTALDSASREKLNVDVESLQPPDHAPVHCYSPDRSSCCSPALGSCMASACCPLGTKGWSTLSVALVISSLMLRQTAVAELRFSSGDHRAYYSGSLQPASRRNSAGVVNRVWAAQFLSAQVLTRIWALQPWEPVDSSSYTYFFILFRGGAQGPFLRCLRLSTGAQPPSRQSAGTPCEPIIEIALI